MFRNVFKIEAFIFKIQRYQYYGEIISYIKNYQLEIIIFLSIHHLKSL